MSVSFQPSPFTSLGFDPAYLSTFEDKLFIEGPKTARRLTNFFTLLLLATVIATYGVLSNSSATVIGAMVVAPLILRLHPESHRGSSPFPGGPSFTLTIAGRRIHSSVQTLARFV